MSELHKMVRFVLALWIILLFGTLLSIASALAYDLEISSETGYLLIWTAIIMLMISGLMLLLGRVRDQRMNAMGRSE
jgi:TRAP-type mannitol/chloroaromatic compound transport system permease small subunit